MSKVIQDCIGFALQRSVIGVGTLVTLSHPLTPSQPIRYKTKTNHDLVTCIFPTLEAFLHVFTLSSHWLLVTFTFVLIGRCDYTVLWFWFYVVQHSVEKSSSIKYNITLDRMLVHSRPLMTPTFSQVAR